MIIRPATEADKAELSEFCCTGDVDGWAKDVEDAIRTALAWKRGYANRRISVLQDDDGRVVAVAVYRFIFAIHPAYGWAVEALAVRLDRQGEELGIRFMSDLMEILASECPGGLVQWFVHEDNAVMQGISEKVGALKRIVEPPPPNYDSWLIRLPGGLGQPPVI